MGYRYGTTISRENAIDEISLRFTCSTIYCRKYIYVNAIKLSQDLR